MIERWRPVPDYDGHYSVSDQGRVRSEPHPVIKTDGRDYITRQKILTATPHYKSGHLHVTLRWDGKPRTEAVHRLVLLAFVGPCPPGMETCHWDDNPANNHLENLRWGTRSDNKFDLVRNGRFGNATHCKHGHELTPDNVYVYRRGNRTDRECKPCNFARTRARRQRRKAAA